MLFIDSAHQRSREAFLGFFQGWGTGAIMPIGTIRGIDGYSAEHDLVTLGELNRDLGLIPRFFQDEPIGRFTKFTIFFLIAQVIVAFGHKE
jgi:hypothetical protein